MRSGSQHLFLWITGLMVAFCLTACKGGQDDQKGIIAIWQIRSINVNGMEIGDGKGFLHFHEDGTVQSRTGPGLYDEGKWEIHPEDKTLIMKQDTSSLKYSYALAGDSLTMQTNEGGIALLLKSFKVDKLPVDPAEDMEEASKGVGPVN
jgi:hypothetical protein